MKPEYEKVLKWWSKLERKLKDKPETIKILRKRSMNSAISVLDNIRGLDFSEISTSLYFTTQDLKMQEFTKLYDAQVELAAIDDGLDDLIDSVNITQILNVFLADISATNREIFISRYYDFESIKSISTRLHMTENSVNTRLTRMREKLKKELLKGGICVWRAELNVWK